MTTLGFNENGEGSEVNLDQYGNPVRKTKRPGSTTAAPAASNATNFAIDESTGKSYQVLSAPVFSLGKPPSTVFMRRTAVQVNNSWQWNYERYSESRKAWIPIEASDTTIALWKSQNDKIQQNPEAWIESQTITPEFGVQEEASFERPETEDEFVFSPQYRFLDIDDEDDDEDQDESMDFDDMDEVDASMLHAEMRTTTTIFVDPENERAIIQTTTEIFIATYGPHFTHLADELLERMAMQAALIHEMAVQEVARVIEHNGTLDDDYALEMGSAMNNSQLEYDEFQDKQFEEELAEAIKQSAAEHEAQAIQKAQNDTIIAGVAALYNQLSLFAAAATLGAAAKRAEMLAQETNSTAVPKATDSQNTPTFKA